MKNFPILKIMSWLILIAGILIFYNVINPMPENWLNFLVFAALALAIYPKDENK